MNYRADIQVLRGIAVSLVILFHLELTPFGTGFLGVDIFFVISGYLMAQLYPQGQAKTFYTRRIRRLLPSYFTAACLTLLACSLLTIPDDYQQAQHQSFYALIYASNIGFWLQKSYFSTTSFTPLLHLWSLAIEIQFYLLVPAIALLFRRNKWIFEFALVASLLSCLLIVNISPKTAFFMLPLRAWEFLLGYWAGQSAIKNQLPESWTGAIRAGLILLILCIPFYPIKTRELSSLIGHPALFAVITCVTTALLLRLGVPEYITRSAPGKALEKLGTYSYSVYLVHFPVIVLVNYQPYEGTRLLTTSTSSALTMAALILTLSALSFLKIEKQKALTNPKWIILLGTGAVMLALISGALIQSLRYPEDDYPGLYAWKNRDDFRCGTLADLLPEDNATCVINTPYMPDALPILLVGNSHADSIKQTFATIASEKGFNTHFYVNNQPLYKSRDIIRKARELKSKSLVIHSSPGSIDLKELKMLAKEARELGIKTSILLPIPTYSFNIPKALYYRSLTGKKINHQRKEDYWGKNQEEITKIRSIDHLITISTADTLCKPNCLIESDQGIPLYYDSNHLTLTGANFLSTPITEAIRLTTEP